MILQSPKLARLSHLTHGFSTRLGGVSSGAQATLDLGGTDPIATRNKARFAQRLGLSSADQLVQISQVHRDGIRALLSAEDVDAVRGQEADGLISQVPQLAAGVRTADCAPVLIAALERAEATEAAAVAAVHAGWRSAVLNIVPQTIERLRALGATAFIAAIGPTIGVERFEVGDEVIEAAREALGEAPPTIDGPRRKHLDLVGMLKIQLQRASVQQIDQVGGCTFDNPALFFSHRRDQGDTGRMLSAIGLLA